MQIRSIPNNVYTISATNFNPRNCSDNIIILCPYANAVNKTYYFSFNFLSSLKKKTIQIIIPAFGEVLTGYSTGTGYFPANSNIYIQSTTFPYPVRIVDSANVNIYIQSCSFTNIGYNIADRLNYTPQGQITKEISAKVNYLIYFDKDNLSTTEGKYYILNGNRLYIPDTYHAINPVQMSFGDVNLLSNQSHFTIYWGYNCQNGKFTIGYLDSNIFNCPYIIFYGTRQFYIANPLTIPVVLKKGDDRCSTIINTTFCNGITTDLTPGCGILYFDNCLIFTPPIISSNVYVVTSIVAQTNTLMSFGGNSSILVTGYGNSYLWNVVSNVSPVPNILSPNSAGNVDIVLGKGQLFPFDRVPNYLTSNKIFLVDSYNSYSLILTQPSTVKLLTENETVYRRLFNSVGYKIAFNTIINYINSASINFINSTNSLSIYSDSNSTITVNTLTLSASNVASSYLLTTSGSGIINFIGSSNLTISNGKNFWTNSANLSFSSPFIFNLLPNSYIFSGREYAGINSIYTQGINLLSNSSPYSISTDRYLSLRPSTSDIILNNSYFSNGLEISNVSLTISNSTILNNSNVYLIDNNIDVNLINDRLFLNSYNYVSSNVSLIGDSNSVYNLIGNLFSHTTIFASNNTNSNSRYLEKVGNVNLATNNGSYNLDSIVNDQTVSVDVPFKLSTNVSNVTVNSTNFPNQLEFISLSNIINLTNVTFNNSINLKNQKGVLNFSNSQITVDYGNCFFKNQKDNNFGKTDLKFTILSTASATYNYFNSEPSFLSNINVQGPGVFNLGINTNPINRVLKYNTTSNSSNLSIYAQRQQVINADQIVNIIVSNISTNTDPYALTLCGNSTVILSSDVSLTNVNRDILYCVGNLNVNILGNSLINGLHNIPITSNISEYGSLNIGDTSFSNAVYPYVYWPNADQILNSTPFTTNKNYVATSWLPKTINLTKMSGNLKLQTNFVYGPKYSSNNGNIEFLFTVLPNASVSAINGNLQFDSATSILQGVNSDIVNNLFNNDVVSHGYVGGLNNDYVKSVSGGNKLSFNLNFHNDPYNYYFGNLCANIIIADNENSFYPKISYNLSESGNYTPNYSLQLTDGTKNLSNVHLDLVNDTSQIIKYKLNIANSRPLILDAYVYPILPDGSKPNADVTASYSSDDDSTTSGFYFNGLSELTISNIIGIIPYNVWSIDLDLNADNLGGEFTLLEFNSANVYINSSTVNLSFNGNTIINGSYTEEISNVMLSYDGNLNLYVNGEYIDSSSDNDYENIAVNYLTLGNGLIGYISNVRICNDANNSSITYFNGMTEVASLQSQETKIFNSNYVGRVVYGTESQYTYLKPTSVFGTTQNYTTNNMILNIKGDITSDEYWSSESFQLGAFLIPDQVGLPVCTSTLTVINDYPNYLYPLAKYETSYIAEDNTHWSGFSSNIYTLNTIQQQGELDLNTTTYTRDFYLSIKMANLPDSGSANILVYTDTQNNEGITFTFYDGVSNANISEVSFTRKSSYHYVNLNNTTTIKVRAEIDGSNKTAGDAYRGNIVLQPLFEVEGYYPNGLIPTVTSYAGFIFVIPYLVKYGINNVINPLVNNYTLINSITSPYDIDLYTPLYLYAELVSKANTNVNVELQINTNNQPYTILNTKANSNISINNSNSFNFVIPKGSTRATNYGNLIILNDNKIWGDHTIITSVINVTANNVIQPAYNQTIEIPYTEINRRSITISGQNVDKLIYTDSNLISSETITSSYSNLSAIPENSNIMTKQARHWISITSNSIPHTMGVISSLEAELNFKLYSSGTETDVTEQVMIYDSNKENGNLLSTIPVNGTKAYIDVSNVDFSSTTQSSGRIINIYGNITSSGVNSDYSDIPENILLLSLNYANATVDAGSSQDNIIIGNWKIITGPDESLLFQYKHKSTDTWVDSTFYINSENLN